MLEKYNDMISLDELEEILDIGKNKAYELLKNKDIASFKIGRNYKIPKKAVIDYISKQLEAASIDGVTFDVEE